MVGKNIATDQLTRQSMTVKKASGAILLLLLRSALSIPFSDFYKRPPSYAGASGGLVSGDTSTEEEILRWPCYFYGSIEQDIAVSYFIESVAILIDKL